MFQLYNVHCRYAVSLYRRASTMSVAPRVAGWPEPITCTLIFTGINICIPTNSI